MRRRVFQAAAAAGAVGLLVAGTVAYRAIARPERPPLVGDVSTSSQRALGIACAFGLAGPRDRARAQVATLAADGVRATETFFWYGQVFERGEHGVAADVAEALTWYRLAAARGHEGARAALDRLG